jgi:large subunit ribosomal protein L38
LKSNKTLEKLAHDHKLEVDLTEVRKDWLKSVGPYHKKDIADHYGLFEHLYGEGYFVPFTHLDISYNLSDGLNLPVCTGNVIKPVEALERPTVSYESDNNSLWTLVLTSLDGHLTEHDKEYVHWFVANIPGDHVEKGNTLVEYLQPFPLKGTGYHRYAFLLYKQSSEVSYDLPTG